MSVITGTQGNDTLNGTEASDTIDGLGGDDIVEAGGGDDIVRGGAGRDLLWGGLGGDSIEAGDGGGEIHGEAGNDALIGGAGADYIWDGAGDDSVYGGAGDDVLSSSWYARHGISVSPSGSDTLDGGDGNDLILVHRESVTNGNFVRATGGAGRDTIEIGSYGGNNAFIVDAGLDDDVVNLRGERFEVFTVSAGAGKDLVFFELLSGPASVTLGAGADIVRIGRQVSERVGLASITIDDFQGGTAGDRLDFDTFVAAALTNWDQAANPFGSGHLRLIEKGRDTILQIDRDGAAGGHGFVNLVTFSNLARTALNAFNLGGYDPTGGWAGITVTGTEGADTLDGTAGADTIEGLGGGDSIDGGGGDDLLRGGSGYDVIWGGTGADRIEAGAGGGEIFGEQGGDTIVGGEGVDVVWDGAGDDHVSGGGGDDELRSSWYRRDEVSLAASGSDTLDGGDGNDLILIRREAGVSGETVRALGGAGNDIVDIVSAGTSSYMVDSGSGDDSVLIRSERAESFSVSAGDGRDLVFVELAAGPVAVSLGAGRDELRIGEQVGLRLGSAAILVQDFEAGPLGDRLDFDVFLAATLAGWDGIANPFGTGHLELVQSGADALLRIDRDGAGASHGFVTLVTFANADVAGFTVENLDGFTADGGVVQGRTIVGTEGPDSLNGTAGGDTIDALGGNDTVEGGGGDDLIRGGAGYDVLWGGLGADSIEAGGDGGYIYGEAGDDRLAGGDGRDRIFDGAGNDVVTGGAGDDQLRSATYFRNEASASSSGSDRLDAGDGDDLILIQRDSTTAGDVVTAIGGAGRDTIDIGSYGGRNAYAVDSGPDDDLVILVSGQDEAFDVDSGSGADIVQIDYVAGTASLALGIGADVLRIGQLQQNHLLTASIVADDFETGAGGDRLDFDLFLAEALIGWDGSANPFAAGFLRLVASGADTLLQIDRDARAGAHAAVTLVTFRNADPAGFTAFNLDGFTPVTRVAGTDAGEALEGTSGNDWMEGGGGGDVLRLHEGGDDKGFGGTGDDLLYFGPAFAAGDSADGGAGRDALVLQGDYLLTLGAGSLAGIESISLQSGSRTTWGDTANNFYDYDLTMADSNVPAGQQLIVNGQSLRLGEDFSFDGSAETDGSFLVYAGHGVDLLKGGAGNDVFFFEGSRWGAGDRVDGGAGRDSVVISAGSGLNRFEFGPEHFVNIESISVSARYATDPSQKPSYELVLHNANVTPGGSLIVNANQLVDPGQTVNINGSAVAGGNLMLLGGAGHDTFAGGAGNDLLLGGLGADSLSGGNGADTFRYDSASHSAGAADLIGDFQSGLDKVDLSRIDANANANAAGDQAFTWVGANAFSGAAGELRTYEADGYRWVAGDTNGDGTADLLIAFQAGTAPLVQGDFLL